MAIKQLFNYSVETEAPTRKRMVTTMLLVWLAWFFVNLGANGLFYISLHGRPGARPPGEILYFLGVSVVGIVVALHLSKKWNLEMPILPEKRGLGFWIGTTVFLALAVFLGLNAMTEQGMTLADVAQRSPVWIIAPVFVLGPTMLAYTLLWYGFYLPGIRRLLGDSKAATALAIILTAVIYGVYHLASIDELMTLPAMLNEIFITSIIGVAFGTYVVLARSLLVAFLVNWLINWFVFTPVETFHPSAALWPLGYIILAVVWLAYRFLWVEKKQ
ncbi:MAG: CPBP family intramembrane metalloprotease [Chloroflexi bacterium]|nr:CPBP family intramembrane metalloprotease [Chloroflexota bacterium]